MSIYRRVAELTRQTSEMLIAIDYQREPTDDACPIQYARWAIAFDYESDAIHDTAQWWGKPYALEQLERCKQQHRRK